MAKKRSRPATIAWLGKPEKANYPAALSYLSLSLPPKQAKKHVEALRRAPVVDFKAKDIFRASQLSLLGVSNWHVDKDLSKIRAGKRLSPILLVRAPELMRVVVADGYHRMCAVYSLDEDAVIPCKIV
jgi:hypothetical protein